MSEHGMEKKSSQRPKNELLAKVKVDNIVDQFL